MWSNWQWSWLWDDWNAAVRRSLMRRFSRRQMTALRWQWRIGLTVKAGMVLIPLFLLFSLLVPHADSLLLTVLLVWSLFQTALLVAHVLLGVRYGVSYSWAFHHVRPLLLSGLSANLDLKSKALVAALTGTVSLITLVALARM
jgi:hypothetical protein